MKTHESIQHEMNQERRAYQAKMARDIAQDRADKKVKRQPIVTKGSVQEFLNTQPADRVMQYVGRALVVLFKNQTADEQRTNDTVENNGVGFTGGDSYSGSLSAKSFIKFGKLQDWQTAKWTKKNAKGYSRLAKYHKQLDLAAQAKRAS